MATNTPAWEDTEQVDSTPQWADTESLLPSVAQSAAIGSQATTQQAAAKDYAENTGLTTALATRLPSDVGKGFQTAGRELYNVAGAYAFEAIGEPELQLQQLEGQTDESGRTPLEQGAADLPAAGQLLASGTRGLIETAPQLAAVAGAQALGIPAPLAAGAVFGSTPEGFDPKQALIAAALPVVGKFTGAVAEVAAGKAGVSSARALDFINRAGGAGGAAALLSADQLRTILQLPPEQRQQAFIDAAGNVASLSLLGLMEEPSEATMRRRAGYQSQEQALRTSRQNQEQKTREAQAGSIPVEAEVTPVPSTPQPSTSTQIENAREIPQATEVHGPVQPPPAETGNISAAEIKDVMGGAGKGVVQGLYDSMFDRMKAGKLPDPFPADKQSPIARRIKAAYDAGQIKNAADIQTLANQPEIVQLPSMLDPKEWKIGQDISGGRDFKPGTVVAVSDNDIVIKHKDGSRTILQASHKIPLTKTTETQPPPGEVPLKSEVDVSQLPTVEEGKKLGLTYTKGLGNIVINRTLQETIQTGRNPNGKKVSPAELETLKARAQANIEEFNAHLGRAQAQPPAPILPETKSTATTVPGTGPPSLEATGDRPGKTIATPPPRDYTPAVRGESGTVYTGASHPEARDKARAAGEKIAPRGYALPDGTFVTLLDAARAKMRQQNEIKRYATTDAARPDAVQVKPGDEAPVRFVGLDPLGKHIGWYEPLKPFESNDGGLYFPHEQGRFKISSGQLQSAGFKIPPAELEKFHAAGGIDKRPAKSDIAPSGLPPTSGPRMDVREPAAPGPATGPVGETAVAPQPEVRLGEPGQGESPVSGRPAGPGPRTADEPAGPAQRPGAGTGRAARTGVAPGAGADLPAAGSAGSEAGAEPPVVRPPPATPADQNHILPHDQDWIPTGDKAKARANLDAIQLLKTLEAEDRNATPEEKTVLAQYVGWGGLKQVFDEGKASYRQRGQYYGAEQETEYKNWEKNWGKLYDETKAAVDPEAWRSAARSVLNAHYTSREAINGVWAAVRHLGFAGGTALETSSGVGNFLGLIPEAIRDKTRWNAVEKDDVSGRILKKLYPQARVQNTGFETARLAANSQDLIIGNVPFDASGPSDDRYPQFSLHNYFIARSLDLLKPGGVMAVITSDSTLDSPSSKKARAYFAERADLVGAMRLPNNAFAKNAGTEVTTDVLFFRKKDDTAFAGQPFERTQETQTHKGDPIEVNQYYVTHPEMLLGRLSHEGTMYGPDQPALIPIPGAKLPEQMAAAAARLPANVFGAPQTVKDIVAPEPEAADAGAKLGQLVLSGDKVMQVQTDGSLLKPDWAHDPKKVAQAKRYLKIRDTAQGYIADMLNPSKTDAEISAGRKTLNTVYDEYRKKHGALNARSSNYLDDDVDYPLALALEDQVAQTKEWVKSKILTERTIFPRRPPEHADTVNDALDVSLNYLGKVDPDYLARLTGKTVDEIKNELRSSGAAFENPESGLWEARARYLSGQVRAKLLEARRLVADNPRFQSNVTELEKAQPARVPIRDISVKLGATWVPPEIIARFLQDKLEVTADVHFTPVTGNWSVSPRAGHGAALNVVQYGIQGWKGHELVEAALNLKSPVVTRSESYVSDAGKNAVREVRDPGASAEAAAKQDQVQRLWGEWSKTTPDVAAALENIYNANYNGTVAPRFEGASWDHYPNASVTVKLRPHQKEVVARMLQNSTLLAHAVGTGKTYAMITAAMEQRRLGLARKPMIVVQNATLEQFAASFKRLYPTARILVPGRAERSSVSRNKTMARIATGNWDCVIIPQSFVNLLPDDVARETEYIDRQTDELKDAILEEKFKSGKRSPKAADLQRALERLENRLKDLADRKKDNVLTFEQTGVDAIFVDEAHAYKKLEFATRMDNIKGLDKGASQRAFSMYMKVRWIQEQNQGRNVTFATGTPVSNTLAEAWNMMRFVRPDVLKAFHMEKFDEFASTFGDRVTNMEMTAGGTWKPVTRFAKFTNGPELIAAWRTVADVVTPEELNLPGLPVLKNGKPTGVVIPQSPALKSYIEVLRKMLSDFEQMSGQEKRDNSHIPLVVYGRAKKASLDLRMIDPTLADHPASKLNAAADQILRIYRESTPVKGTQLVFADIYQDNPDHPRFNVYDEVKKKLVERGVPADEIAIVTADLKDAKREALFDKVVQGEVRVMIGSTERMGIGVNVQERLIALHHLDAPARPMDMEQRNGRGIRQGNNNPVIEELRYGVENTLDAALFQRLATKQKFVNQILRGQITGRDFEDAANETSLNYEEQMAAFSGDKRTMEKFGLENRVRNLEGLRKGHLDQVRQSKVEIDDLETRKIPATKSRLETEKARAARFATAFPPDQEPVLTGEGGKTISGRKEISESLDKVFQNKIAEAKGKIAKRVNLMEPIRSSPGAVLLNGEKIDFDAVVPVAAHDATTLDPETGKRIVTAAAGTAQPDRAAIYWHWPDRPNDPHEVNTGSGLLSSVTADVQRTAREPEFTGGHLASQQKNLVQLKGFVQQPFEQEKELADTKTKLAALEAELAAEGKAKAATDKAARNPPTAASGEEEGNGDVSGITPMGFAMGKEFSPPTIEDVVSGKLAPPRKPHPLITPGMAVVVDNFRQSVDRAWESLRGTLGQFQLRTFPRVTLKDPRLGELGARWISSAVAARPMAEVFAADVLGDSGVDPVQLGAALTEDNLRSLKAAFTEKADEAENRQEIAGDLRGQMESIQDMVADDPQARREWQQLNRELQRISQLTDENVQRFREQASAVKSFVGAPGFPFTTEASYQGFLDRSGTQPVLERHKSLWESVVDPQYKAAMNLDPGFELPSRGLQTGARINLRAVQPDEDLANVARTLPKPNLLGTLRRKSPFGIQAKGTGEAYALNYYDLMENTFRRQMEIANKNEFENALVKAKQAVIDKPGQDVVIEGQPAEAFPLKRQRTILPGGGGVSQNQSIYINKKLANEYEIAADVRRSEFNALGKILAPTLNRAALAGLTDATTHAVNLFSALMTLPGGSGNLLQDSLLSALPGRPDAVIAIGRALAKGLSDSRAQQAALAQIGAMKPGLYRNVGASPLEWLHLGSNMLRWIDTATRLALDESYQRLAAQGYVENSETARREFINQIGQYNLRAQPWWLRVARQSGLGPFATAGVSFNNLGVRAALGPLLGPGVRATSAATAIALRANMFAKIVGLIATIALLNWLLTHKKGGGVAGRPGVRLGAIDTGRDDKQGRPLQLDILSMTGPGRGLRVIGARGFIEGKLHGLPTGTAADAAARDIINSATAPFAGPAVRFASVAATGRPPSIGVPRSSRVVPPGENQAAANLKEAILEANPVVAGLNKAAQPGSTGLMEELKTQLPRLVPQSGKQPEMMKHYAAIVDHAQAVPFIEDVIGQARGMTMAERIPYLKQSVLRLSDPQDRAKAIREFKMRRL